MLPALIAIIVILVCAVIFLTIRMVNYKNAYLFYTVAVDRICKASNTYDEALALFSTTYHLSEEEIVRRLQSDSQTSSK